MNIKLLLPIIAMTIIPVVYADTVTVTSQDYVDNVMNTKQNKLFAFSGTKGSGKDTASKMLQYCLSVPKIFRQYWIYKYFGKLFPKSWKITAFADIMKQMLSNLLNIPVNKFNDRTFKEKSYVCLDTLECSDYVNEAKTFSDVQFNKYAKELNKDIKKYHLTIRQLMQFFATNVMRTFFGNKVWINSTLRNASRNTIISDCRFINEANEIKLHGGKIIYIGTSNTNFGQHQSEKEMEWMLQNNMYNITVDNSGTLKDLFNKIKNIANDF